MNSHTTHLQNDPPRLSRIHGKLRASKHLALAHDAREKQHVLLRTVAPRRHRPRPFARLHGQKLYHLGARLGDLCKLREAELLENFRLRAKLLPGGAEVKDLDVRRTFKVEFRMDSKGQKAKQRRDSYS